MKIFIKYYSLKRTVNELGPVNISASPFRETYNCFIKAVSKS